MVLRDEQRKRSITDVESAWKSLSIREMVLLKSTPVRIHCDLCHRLSPREFLASYPTPSGMYYVCLNCLALKGRSAVILELNIQHSKKGRVDILELKQSWFQALDSQEWISRSDSSTSIRAVLGLTITKVIRYE